MIVKKNIQPQLSDGYKVEIRQLPPLLRASEFYKSIETYIDDIKRKYYIQGKLKEKERINSRCYCIFKSKELMEKFMLEYNKIFCDEKGQYYRPDVRKSLNQNYLDEDASLPNTKENTYLNSLLYKEFEDAENAKKIIFQDSQLANDFNRQSEQNQTEEKKKFEKVKTHIVKAMEFRHLEEKKQHEQIEMMQKNVIHTQESPIKSSKGEKFRKFIFVPKAK